MVGIVVLGTCGVELFVIFLIICFLKKYVSAYLGFFQLTIIFHGGGGDVHVNSADSTVLVFHGIYGLNAFQNVLNGIVYGVLARLNGKTLVSHILQGNDLGGNFLLSELFSGNMLVFQMIGAVKAAVYAIIGQIKRGKQHDASAVKIFFYPACKGENTLVQVVKSAFCQKDGFTVGHTLELFSFFQN